jgi:phage shock protein C
MASYCAACGVSLPGGARFCSACGRPVTEPGFAAMPARPLTRPLVGRKLAGVCQGLANHLGWDVTLVRVLAVVLAVFTFPIGLLLYGVMWLVMPEEARALPATTHLDPIS